MLRNVYVINSFFHLILDASQIKFANGVQFLVPFNWSLTNLGLFWPESFPTYIITTLGLIYIVINWRHCTSTPTTLIIRPASRIIQTSIFLTVYIFIPLLLLDGPVCSNNHFIKTLQPNHVRTREYVEFDRYGFKSNPDGDKIDTFSS